MQTRKIYTPSLVVLGLEIVENAQDGYYIDPEDPPFMNGWCYECTMYKDETRAAVLEAFKEAPGEMDFSVIPKDVPKRGRPKA